MELNRSNFDLKKCRNSIGIRQSKLSLIKNFIRQFLPGQYKLEGRLSYSQDWHFEIVISPAVEEMMSLVVSTLNCRAKLVIFSGCQ